VTPRKRSRRPARLGIFLKEPVPGRVKTRLARGAGEEWAAGFYRALVEDALEWLARFPVAERTLFFSPAHARAACAGLAPRGRRYRMVPQAPGDLGARLQAAFRVLLAGGPTRAVVLGTDTPGVDARILRSAFQALDHSDLVLGPALDGGYYLIGLRRPAPRLFENVPWSTSRVLAATRQRADRLGLATRLLEPLGDIDRLADLPPLAEELIEAWWAALRTHHPSFPLRTFRYLFWRLDLEAHPVRPAPIRGKPRKGLTAPPTALK
jgi:rSAM/selenodomain-associated transferase 1